MKRFVLASSSPRRSELLRAIGLPFEVARPDIDETPHSGEAADQYVMRLSHEKAQAVASQFPDSLILSADTTVVDYGQILGKPDDPAHAESMLRQLRNRSHIGHTGLTMLDTSSGQSITRLVTTTVFMRAMTDAEIAAYIASGDPMGKAGSYAIQNQQYHPVERLDGCYTNVVGLPVCMVAAMLAEFGESVPTRIVCSPEKLPCQFSTV
jgi:septum formation protein